MWRVELPPLASAISHPTPPRTPALTVTATLLSTLVSEAGVARLAFGLVPAPVPNSPRPADAEGCTPELIILTRVCAERWRPLPADADVEDAWECVQRDDLSTTKSTTSLRTTALPPPHTQHCYPAAAGVSTKPLGPWALL